jgi:hypothetical protein
LTVLSLIIMRKRMLSIIKMFNRLLEKDLICRIKIDDEEPNCVLVTQLIFVSVLFTLLFVSKIINTYICPRER